MWLVLWILGVPKLLYHIFIPSVIIFLYLAYKAYHFLFKSRQPQLVLRQKISQVMVSSRTRMGCNAGNKSSTSLAATLVVLMIASRTGECLEQDAIILSPLASLAKSIINTATLGESLRINFGPTDIVRNFASFTWRTGWPITMPSGFIDKAQDFYNRVADRVAAASVKDVPRKTLVALKVDLDTIVDSIVDQVRQSPDGLYTNYLNTKVNGISLEDACTNVGIQLKAYSVDIKNYRNIAGMVLGVPVVPTIASTMVNVADTGVKGLGTVTGFTSDLITKPHELPGNAIGALTSISGSALNSINSLRSSLPLVPGSNVNLFSQGQQQAQSQMPLMVEQIQ